LIELRPEFLTFKIVTMETTEQEVFLYTSIYVQINDEENVTELIARLVVQETKSSHNLPRVRYIN